MHITAPERTTRNGNTRQKVDPVQTWSSVGKSRNSSGPAFKCGQYADISEAADCRGSNRRRKSMCKGYSRTPPHTLGGFLFRPSREFLGFPASGTTRRSFVDDEIDRLPRGCCQRVGEKGNRMAGNTAKRGQQIRPASRVCGALAQGVLVRVLKWVW